MTFFARGLAERGFRAVRLEFPYMASHRKTGKRRPPDREPVLRETWLQVVNMPGSEHLVIGGKSMGRRIAGLVADDADVAFLLGTSSAARFNVPMKIEPPIPGSAFLQEPTVLMDNDGRYYTLIGLKKSATQQIVLVFRQVLMFG
jgi:hypothetical protein